MEALSPPTMAVTVTEAPSPLNPPTPSLIPVFDLENFKAEGSDGSAARRADSEIPSEEGGADAAATMKHAGVVYS